MNKVCKPIAIVTLTKDFNYGNRLQNYAVQQIIENMGYEVRTLFNLTDSEYMKHKSFKEWIKYIINYKDARVYLKIARMFNKFNKKYIYFGEKIIKNGDLNYLNNCYDAFVTGSDQVWNPNWSFLSDIEYLGFVEDNIKKISLSSSFGVNEIPESKREEVSRYLKRIDFISVREEAGAEIVRKLVNRTSKVLIDPTMYISLEKWIGIERKPKELAKEEYVLIYILGSHNSEVYEKIFEFTKKKNIKIYNLARNRLNDKIPIGPEEFLYLIHNAKYVVTDSFHGSVFSILFKTDFYVFKRENNKEDMSSRIVTLLRKMHLSNRFVHARAMDFENRISADVWHETEECLAIEQKCFKEYIESALDGEGFRYM